ncbi:MAG: hypothetical protein LPK15_07365, partial [Alteromonadaceae bacterium]|uniref:hypothetical protein n=1 Tax=Marinobacter sp. TaxID=50741 RepID=UPI0029C2B8F2
PAPDVLMGKSGSLPGWQLCRGISGSFRVEWVAGFVWNQWQPWSGIRSSLAVLVVDADVTVHLTDILVSKLAQQSEH